MGKDGVNLEMVAAAEAKARQAEEDLAQKRVPYESDPLFMYLWNRRFGTPAYRAGRFVRFMDRKVARLVGFEKARQNYSVLVDLPVRLCEHVERLRATLTGEASTRPEALLAPVGASNHLQARPSAARQ